MTYSPFPTIDNIKTENYSLDIFECENGKRIVAIDEVNKFSICEPFKDGGGLREIYDEVKNPNLQEKEIDKLLTNYFEININSWEEVKSETGSLIENFL